MQSTKQSQVAKQKKEGQYPSYIKDPPILKQSANASYIKECPALKTFLY